LNPTGANPTGLTISTKRKREIYKIACEYNLLILEDDPYYFLHFEEVTYIILRQKNIGRNLSFNQKNPVSFLSMDTENRVLRFDSLSKVLSAGLRIGYVTGPKQLLERIELHVQSSVIHTPALTQVRKSQFGILPVLTERKICLKFR
jgi:kynurenine/2-aminoadipate aminotransferase